jgi:hypothetical protein
MSTITGQDVQRVDENLYMSIRKMAVELSMVRSTGYGFIIMLFISLIVGFFAEEAATPWFILSLAAPVFVTMCLLVLSCIRYIKASMVMVERAKENIKMRSTIINMMRDRQDRAYRPANKFMES